MSCQNPKEHEIILPVGCQHSPNSPLNTLNIRKELPGYLKACMHCE